MRVRVFITVAALGALAAPAAAQTYVSGGVGAAVTRSYSSSGQGYSFDGSDAEVVSWMLRAGTSLNSLFGVELEFARDARVDIETNPIIYANAGATRNLGATSATAAGANVTSQLAIFPISNIETRQRTTTWNATAFVRKSIAARTELVFLGGVTFSRVTQRSRFSYDPRILAIRAPSDTETTAYGAGPLVGAEARIGMTDQLQLTPGLRVHSLGNDLTSGIVLRPSVTLGWAF